MAKQKKTTKSAIIVEKESEIKQKEVSDIVGGTLRIEQFISILVSVSFLILYRFIYLWSDTISLWIVGGEIVIDAYMLISALISFVILVSLFLFVIYSPKFSKFALKSGISAIGGFLFANVIYFLNGSSFVFVGEFLFPLYYLIIFLPTSIIANILVYQKKINDTFIYLLFLNVFLSTIIAFSFIDKGSISTDSFWIIKIVIGSLIFNLIMLSTLCYVAIKYR